ncbi:MAG: DNA adenine methylase [Leptolyngbyaceae cyanobacterium bins.59]|nr:DNA adenine methylase [Leptolyngbyaceae cyanobacterium bins.59]
MILESPFIRSSLIEPRPFLKWAGGKGRLIQQYLPYFPRYYQTYYEPFLGGGAIFFYLTPPKAVLMDINSELVNVYRCVKDSVEPLISLLENHRQCHSRDYYYHIRSLRNGDSLERAARMIYLNKTCFNGLYRENLKGEFNVPMGRYKNPQIFDEKLLRAASDALRNTEIYAEPFDYTLKLARSRQDFVYFDPPYYPISPTSNFTGYSRFSFNQEDQRHLKNVFATLAERGVQVMLSNSDCPFVRELYADFRIQTILATRAINSNPGKRGTINEVLITSY